VTTLGATGLEVSRIGLGLAALGRPAYINLGHGEDLGEDRSVDALEARAHAVLDAAWRGGVRYYDAARSYGRAEEFLASWLRARGIWPGEVAVGSKWGYAYTGEWRLDAEHHEVKELSVDQLRRQREETNARLGPWLGLYQIHSATLDSGVLEDTEVRAELDSLREAGIAVGLSTTGPKQSETIDRAVAVGGFQAVQATWNLLEPSAGPALQRAHDAGLGIIVKEAIANGRLTARGDVEPLTRAAADRGVPPDALALAAALAQPWADVVLSGAATVATLESNLRALGVEAAGLEIAPEDPEAYWSARGSLAWN
jgi:aryl-alcohol dehydrogenase-like predicted oxidoreductase